MSSYYLWLSHEVVAKILEEIYVNNKIGKYVDQDFDDEVVNEITEDIRNIINYHMKESKKLFGGRYEI